MQICSHTWGHGFFFRFSIFVHSMRDNLLCILIIIQIDTWIDCRRIFRHIDNEQWRKRSLNKLNVTWALSTRYSYSYSYSFSLWLTHLKPHSSQLYEMKYSMELCREANDFFFGFYNTKAKVTRVNRSQPMERCLMDAKSFEQLTMSLFCFYLLCANWWWIWCWTHLVFEFDFTLRGCVCALVAAISLVRTKIFTWKMVVRIISIKNDCATYRN